RTPAAAELLNKTFQHQQQQPNGSAAAPNAALNQFQQQLQALPPNIIQQLQTLQYQMQQHQQQQQHQHQQQHQQHQQQQQHPSQPPPAQHHPTHQQPPSSAQQQQQQQPQPLLTAHQQQQLHGQFQQQQQKALQQFQQSLRYFPTAAPTQPTAAPPPTAAGNKGVSAASTQPPTQTPPSTAVGNQLKAPNLPPSTQITPLPVNAAPVSIIGGAAQQSIKNSASSAPVTTATSAALSSAAGGGSGSNAASTGGAKPVPTPSISLLPAKAGTSTAAPTAAHQQSKFGAGKTSPVVSAIPPPFPTHFQKPQAIVSSANTATTNITPIGKAGAVPTGAAAMAISVAGASGATKPPQQSANPVPLTKQASPAPPPTSQLGAASSAATTSSTSTPPAAAVAAPKSVTAVGTEQIVAAQKATNSTAASPVGPGVNATRISAAEKNAKPATSEIVEEAKSAETVGNAPAKAKEEQSADNTAKPSAVDTKTDGAAGKGEDAKALKPADAESPAEKLNAPAGDVKVSTNVASGSDVGGDAKPEQSKPPTAKGHERSEIAAPKIDPENKGVEENKNENKSGPTPVSTTKVINLAPAEEPPVLKLTTKELEIGSKKQAVSAKKDLEEKNEDKIKEVTEQKNRAIEKIDITKPKSADTAGKNSPDTVENKSSHVENNEAACAVNVSKNLASTATDIKSKADPVPAAEGDKRQSGKSAAADKPKEEKTKITKSEKVSATVPTATSSAAEQPTQSNSNNHTIAKSTKSKVAETAPDSTNSISEATSTPAKRSGRQIKTVAKSTEKATIEKSEKVSSSSRSRKLKSGISSSSSNSSTVVDVPASPATPKLEQAPSTSASDRKSSRHRLKTIPFQSPLPELAYITKLSASEASNSPKPMSTEDKLIVFYKNEYMAVRNAEGTFYLCQTMQNVYRTSPRISIRWLSEDPNNSGIYIPDFYDHTDIECVLTTVELKRVDKGHLSLPKKEQARIESILKKAIDVEKGLVPRPELTEENPDGLDISLYKDESQIEKKSATGVTPTTTRKSRRSGNSFGTPTTARSSTSASFAASASKARKRSRASIAGASAGDHGVKSSAKKRKLAGKRKSKSKKTTTTDEENESTDDSDAEYKPNQKNTGGASKASPRAQRSPLARARAASPISSTTARTKSMPEKSTSTASSRGERANKRKAAADDTTPTAENAPTPVKKTGGSATSAAGASTATPNASKLANTKISADGAIEANNSTSIVKKISAATAGEKTDVVSSTTNASNAAESTAAISGSSSENGSSSNNRPTRSRK
ncbi:PREDICTED: mucin-5AC-like, partial [Rhagoletis zephyria]|uniref:mucin-5AC-like n=1 Tax=Rhagoletis zephyria TaxID=28612 RepID=UPI0008114DEE